MDRLSCHDRKSHLTIYTWLANIENRGLILSTSGSLILFVSIGLLLVAGMVAFTGFHADATNNTSATVTADANLASNVANPIFSVLGYIALAVAAIALLQAFRNM